MRYFRGAGADACTFRALATPPATCQRPPYDTRPRANENAPGRPESDELSKPYQVKPAIVWPGGKRRFLDRILPYVPKHTCYVEPFAGGLAVLLAKPRSSVEVLNDIDGDLVTFYRCVRFHTDVLLTELEFVLNSRQEFSDFNAQPGLTDIQRAARWFYRNRNCFRGVSLNSFGTGPRGSSASGSRQARLDSIRELNVRLDRVTVENLDWRKCVDLYDRAGTFFFFDPPYTSCSAGQYGAWKTADVLAFRERLRTLRGRWIVTLNDAPDIRQIFDGCPMETIERGRGVRGGRYLELIIRDGIDRSAQDSSPLPACAGSDLPPGRS